MNYHAQIEQLRNDLLNNRNLHTLQQRQEGYLQLVELSEKYLASESNR